MTQRRSLVDLALEGRLEDLEQAWLEAVAEPGDTAPYAKTLAVLCESDMASRALALAETAVQAMTAAGRLEEALEVGMALVTRDAHSDGLAAQLARAVAQRFAAEPWYSVVAELAGLDESSVTGSGLASFEKMRRYTKGHVVYHRGGWGEGLVEDFDPGTQELRIRFASGAIKEIPLSSAVDNMTPLDHDDLRAMALTRREELVRLAEEQPSILIRKVARVFRGRVNSSEVKQLLSPSIVPAKKWASFWKRAKAAAAVDPYLLVEGSTSRPVFELRKKPLSLAEETARRLRHCDNLGQEVVLIREYLERTSDPEAREAILDLAQQHLEAAARSEAGVHAHILDAILLLEQHGRHSATSAASELRAMLYSDTGALQPAAFDLLGTQEARNHAVRLLPEALGESWAEQCIANLTKFPGSVVEGVAGLLSERGHGGLLASLWDQVAPYPQRHPILTYLIGRAYADGEFANVEGAPDSTAVTRVLLHLARVLASSRKSDQALMRLMTRVTSLLVGRRSFLSQVLDNVRREELATFLGICERGGSEFPQEISDLVLRAVARRFPELTAKAERPFWEQDAIYVTREGLAAKRTEYRKLVDELIPANSLQIGAAAAQGDLSENSEWEAAMEEQRNLTTRASMMDADLRKAKLIEDQLLPQGVAAPGTAVTYTDLASSTIHRVRLLGPWDASEPDVVNYLAPVGQPLLGKKPGATVELPSEDGRREVRIDKIEHLF